MGDLHARRVSMGRKDEVQYWAHMGPAKGAGRHECMEGEAVSMHATYTGPCGDRAPTP